AGTGATVQCPTGKRVLGGGVGATTFDLSWIELSGPLDETGETAKTESGDVARSWSVEVGQVGDRRLFRVSAICTADETKPKPSPKPTANARCAGKPVTIIGTPGSDNLVGSPGADVIAGLGGNDTINGGAGNDKLAGEAGNDTLTGGPGNDSLVGGPGVDRLNGGPGVNTVKQCDAADAPEWPRRQETR